ncbi:hypothetical protein M1349_00430 [Patescibacteria group bacterium]|nr:hypothetical protein [Patescibacteria group bacterium]
MIKEDQKSTKDKVSHICKKGTGGTGGNVVYGLGLIGAAVYFLQHADSFGAGVIGILKAIVWPALFVYKFLELLKF